MYKIYKSNDLNKYINEIKMLLHKDTQNSSHVILNRGDWLDSISWLESIFREMQHLEFCNLHTVLDADSNYATCISLANTEIKNLLDKPEITLLRLS